MSGPLRIEFHGVWYDGMNRGSGYREIVHNDCGHRFGRICYTQERKMKTFNLDKLPDFAQSEIEDFYQFLLEKYACQPDENQIAKKPLTPPLG